MSSTSLLLRFAAFGALAFAAMAVMSAIAELPPTQVAATSDRDLVCIDDGASEAFYRVCFEVDGPQPAFPVARD